MVKNLPAMLETWVQSLGQEDPMEKGMATHSSILAWRISWTMEPGGLHTVHGITKSRTWLSDSLLLNYLQQSSTYEHMASSNTKSGKTFRKFDISKNCYMERDFRRKCKRDWSLSKILTVKLQMAKRKMEGTRTMMVNTKNITEWALD